MSARTAGAVVAAVGFAPAIAVAQAPQTITITTTTTVTLAPDEAIADGPPGETAPNTTMDLRAKTGIDRGFRISAAAGAAASDEGGAMLDLRIGWAIARHLLLVGGVTAASETKDLGQLDRAVHAETASLQLWPTDRFWLEGGAGVVFPEHQHGPAPTVTAAVGYELFARPGYSIGAQVRGLLTHDGPAVGVLVGTSWY